MRDRAGVHEPINNQSLPIPIGRPGRFKSDCAAIAEEVRFVEVTGKKPSLTTL